MKKFSCFAEREIDEKPSPATTSSDRAAEAEAVATATAAAFSHSCVLTAAFFALRRLLLPLLQEWPFLLWFLLQWWSDSKMKQEDCAASAATLGWLLGTGTSHGWNPSSLAVVVDIVNIIATTAVVLFVASVGCCDNVARGIDSRSFVWVSSSADEEDFLLQFLCFEIDAMRCHNSHVMSCHVMSCRIVPRPLPHWLSPKANTCVPGFSCYVMLVVVFVCCWYCCVKRKTDTVETYLFASAILYLREWLFLILSFNKKPLRREIMILVIHFIIESRVEDILWKWPRLIWMAQVGFGTCWAWLHKQKSTKRTTVRKMLFPLSQKKNNNNTPQCSTYDFQKLGSQNEWIYFVRQHLVSYNLQFVQRRRIAKKHIQDKTRSHTMATVSSYNPYINLRENPKSAAVSAPPLGIPSGTAMDPWRPSCSNVNVCIL